MAWVGPDALTPTVAVNGRRLAFARTYRDANIWRLTLDGGGVAVPPITQIAPSSFREVAPRYSPDGLLLEPEWLDTNLDLRCRRLACVTAHEHGSVRDHRFAALVARWSADRVRLECRRQLSTLRGQRGWQRPTAGVDHGEVEPLHRGVFAGWAVDLFQFRSEWRGPGLATARRRWGTATGDATRRTGGGDFR